MNAVAVVVGLALGNFAYQAVTLRRWVVAAERSFMQAVGVGTYLFAVWVR